MKKIIFLLALLSIGYAQKNSKFGLSYPVAKYLTSDYEGLYYEKIKNPAFGVGVNLEFYSSIYNDNILLKLYFKANIYAGIGEKKGYLNTAANSLINYCDQNDFFYGLGIGIGYYKFLNVVGKSDPTSPVTIIINGGKILFNHFKLEAAYNYAITERNNKKITDNFEFTIGYIF